MNSLSESAFFEAFYAFLLECQAGAVTPSSKRSKEEEPASRRMKLRYALAEEDWGEAKALEPLAEEPVVVEIPAGRLDQVDMMGECFAWMEEPWNEGDTVEQPQAPTEEDDLLEDAGASNYTYKGQNSPSRI